MDVVSAVCIPDSTCSFNSFIDGGSTVPCGWMAMEEVTAALWNSTQNRNLQLIISAESTIKNTGQQKQTAQT